MPNPYSTEDLGGMTPEQYLGARPTPKTTPAEPYSQQDLGGRSAEEYLGPRPPGEAARRPPPDNSWQGYLQAGVTGAAGQGAAAMAARGVGLIPHPLSKAASVGLMGLGALGGVADHYIEQNHPDAPWWLREGVTAAPGLLVGGVPALARSAGGHLRRTAEWAVPGAVLGAAGVGTGWLPQPSLPSGGDVAEWVSRNAYYGLGLVPAAAVAGAIDIGRSIATRRFDPRAVRNMVAPVASAIGGATNAASNYFFPEDRNMWVPQAAAPPPVATAPIAPRTGAALPPRPQNQLLPVDPSQ